MHTFPSCHVILPGVQSPARSFHRLLSDEGNHIALTYTPSGLRRKNVRLSASAQPREGETKSKRYMRLNILLEPAQYPFMVVTQVVAFAETMTLARIDYQFGGNPVLF